MRILVLLGAGLLIASAHAYDQALEGYIRKPSLGIQGQAPINYFGADNINHLQENYQPAEFQSQSTQEIDEAFDQHQATDLFSSSNGNVELSSGDYTYDKPSQPFKDANNAYLPPLGGAPSEQVPEFIELPKEETGQSSDDSPAIALPSEEPVPEYIQLGCAAALVCVEEQFCDLAGVITKSPNSFSPAQLLRRVPMISCRNPENGVVGKCCRDPDYVDPWPTGNLPANYTGGFDEQGFPSFLNIAKTRPAKPTKTVFTTAKPEFEDDITFQDNSASNVAIQTLLLPGESVPVKTQTRVPQPQKTVTYKPPTQQYFPAKEVVPAQSASPSIEYLPIQEVKPTVPEVVYIPVKKPQPAPAPIKNVYLQPTTPKPAPIRNQYIPPAPTPAPIKNVYLQPTTPKPAPIRNQYVPPAPTPAPIKNVYLRPTTPKPAPIRNEYLPPAPTPAPIKNEYLPPATTRPPPPRTTRPAPAPIKNVYLPPATTQAPKPAPIKIEYLPPSTTQAPKPAPVKIQYIPPSTTQAPVKIQYIPPSTTQAPKPAPIRNEYLPPATTRAPPRPTPAPIKNVYIPVTKAPVKTVQKPTPPKNYYLEPTRPKPTVVVPSREYLPVEQPRPKPTVVVPSREYLPVEQARPSAVVPSRDYVPIKSNSVQAPSRDYFPIKTSPVQAPSRDYFSVDNNTKNYVIELTKKQTAYIEPRTPGAQCGLKNKVNRVEGLSPEDVAFGEIPWQVMILSNSEKKLLCGGVLVAPNAIVTTASCVHGRDASDISIKVGEWKLGYDLKWEEPLPFEIVQVAKVMPHYNWYPSSPSYDHAVLLLEHDVKYDQHVDAVCLADGPYPVAHRNCFATGWGKIVLQVHKEGALMHGIDIDLLGQNECKDRLLNAETQLQIDDTMICGKPKHQRNNVCQVDFGGPLVCDRGDGFYELVGVYSRETGCLPTNQVATFAIIDNEWVRSVISGKYKQSGFAAQSQSQSTIVHEEEECPCKKKKTSQTSASSQYSQFQLASNQEFLPQSY